MTQASIEAYQGSSERMARLIRENLFTGTMKRL